MPYREDCWSEGETSTLVDAWGDRYLELIMGISGRSSGRKLPMPSTPAPVAAGVPRARTSSVRINRIDTVKKKYKIEKAKISDGAIASQWLFYSRLDMLVGSSVPPIKPTPLPSPPLALPLPTFIRRSYSAAGAAAVADRDGGSLSKSSRSSMARERKRKREIGEGDGMRELARGIGRVTKKSFFVSSPLLDSEVDMASHSYVESFFTSSPPIKSEVDMTSYEKSFE
ncbi:hypothetical protein M5K25_022564 [Dendrobium thyrsiflorum]|uniref:Uncharacterized protein n=1 Tax=Dendrobium thyrsiflorum TaxID=117978 RepID=A0ABD0U6J6_DENTH